MSSCRPNSSLLQSCPGYAAAAAEGRTPLLLYPRPNSLTETDVSCRVRAGARFSLVVLDGNWAETNAMSRALESMQSFSLDVGKYKGLFSARRPKQDGFLCTLEAVAYALDVTESNQVSPMLLRPMLRVCIQEEEFALQRGGVRHRCNPGYHGATMFQHSY